MQKQPSVYQGKYIVSVLIIKLESLLISTQKDDLVKKIKIAMLSIILIVIFAAIALFYIKPMLYKHNLPKAVQINTQNQPLLGSANAKIHFVVFEDLKCSNCARFNNEVLPELKEKYIDKGLANYTMINVAFIPGSMSAANAARCVYAQNSALFFPYVDYIYHHQLPENQDWANVPTLLNYASKIEGVDLVKLGVCMLKAPYDDFITNNLKQASAIMNGSVATPSLYVNGILVKELTPAEIDQVVEAVK